MEIYDMFSITVDKHKRPPLHFCCHIAVRYIDKLKIEMYYKSKSKNLENYLKDVAEVVSNATSDNDMDNSDFTNIHEENCETHTESSGNVPSTSNSASVEQMEPPTKFETITKSNTEKKPGPIMQKNPAKVIEFSTKLALDFKFEAKTTRDFLKIFPDNQEEKTKIIDHLKAKNMQFYIQPDREFPVKVVIRGLPRSMDPHMILENLEFQNFKVNKVTQLKSRKDGASSPSFLSKCPVSPNPLRFSKLGVSLPSASKLKSFDRLGKLHNVSGVRISFTWLPNVISNPMRWLRRQSQLSRLSGETTS